MAYRIADNVLTPLGTTTMANYEALRAGHSALTRYASYSGRTEDDYVASRFSDEQRNELMVRGLTWFESLAYHSVKEALTGCAIDVASHRTLFIVSTTKANIDCLSSNEYRKLQPAESAQRIATLLGIQTQPIVVCNACISGVAALVTAQRLLLSGFYDTAIVVGCDVVSHFVVSGFQSLKALSPEPCRPFDIERIGLNLGEAAATLILSNKKPQNGHWQIVSGAIRNDAYHISSPSPKGEGCASAIQYVTDGIDLQSLSAVNVHGTATMYNDQMESKAIAASGLSEVPVNALKGYFGHTLGASGILETVLTMRSVEQGKLFATRGFSEIGVSGKVNISARLLRVSPHSFVKIISGFGGCNAAMYLRNERLEMRNERYDNQTSAENNGVQGNAENNGVQGNHTSHLSSLISHLVNITPNRVMIDGREIHVESKGSKIITELYKSKIGSYPKYYKMDKLSQLGFVASELLLSQETSCQKPRSDRAVVLFNHSSSVCVDREYERTITIGDDYFPSPSLFVYTLPNMVCGETAIRHGYHAETSFYILSSKDETLMNEVIQSTFIDKTIQSMVAGWVDYQDEHTFEADIKLYEKVKK
jgi:3-oxoacyl-[acyl-carrier-protein] synthase-1